MISSDSEIDVSGGFTPPAQVPKTMAGGSDEKTRDKTTREMRTLRPKDSPEKPKVAGKLREEARPELHEKDPRWERYYEVVRDKMGNVRPSELNPGRSTMMNACRGILMLDDSPHRRSEQDPRDPPCLRSVGVRVPASVPFSLLLLLPSGPTSTALVLAYHALNAGKGLPHLG